MKKLSLLIPLAVFMILPALAADIQVAAPAAGATWKTNTTQTVQWSFSGIPDTAQVNIFLWQNGNKLGKIADMVDIGANGQGSRSWNVGALLDAAPPVAGSGYFIRVRLVDSTTFGESGVFSLSSGPTGSQVSQPGHDYNLVNKPKPTLPGVVDVQVNAIHVTAPKSGDAVPPYGGCDVRWNCVNVSAENVSITLLRGGQPAGVLAASVANSGEFNWNVQLQPPDPGNYKLVVETLDKSHRGVSGQFAVMENGTIDILSPTTGATIANGSSQEIVWKRGGNIQKVDISLIRVGIGAKTLLAAGVYAKLGSKIVVLSPGESGQYKILIQDSRNQNGLAESGVFTITVD